MTTTYRHLDFALPGFAELANPPATVPGYRDAVLGLGPLAYWTLDEDQGPTMSDLAATYPLTLSGAYQLGAAQANRSAPGTALRLTDGSAVAAGPILPTSAIGGFTLVGWVRRDDLSQEGELLSQFLAGDPGRMVVRLLTGGGIRYRMFADVSVQTTSAVITTAWTHLAITRAATTITIYANGQPVASDNTQASPLAAGPFALGRTTLALDVTLDQVAVLDHALSAVQIAALSRLARSLPEAAEGL